MPDVVLVIDPHALFRRTLVDLVGAQPGVGRVAESGSVAAFATLVHRHAPDLILLDFPDPIDTVPGGRLAECDEHAAAGAGAVAALRALKDDEPARRVVALMDSDRLDDVVRAVRAGADATLHRHARRTDLVAQLRGLLTGRTRVRNEVVAQLATALRIEAARVPRDLRMLTDTERAVLGCIALGNSDRLIARDLHLDARALSGHIDRVLHRLAFRSRVEAAAWAGHESAVRLNPTVLATAPDPAPI